jgi:hypothetical protein
MLLQLLKHRLVPKGENTSTNEGPTVAGLMIDLDARLYNVADLSDAQVCLSQLFLLRAGRAMTGLYTQASEDLAVVAAQLLSERNHHRLRDYLSCALVSHDD